MSKDVTDMSAASIAIFVSVGSLILSALSLGWNIYRDVIRKPKMRVSLMDAIIVSGNQNKHPKRITATITNFGPAKTTAGMLHLRRTSLWRKIFKKEVYAALQYDYEDPLSGRLPIELEVGQKVTLTFRHLPELFLFKDEFDQLGISDPFGQTHWCTRKNYRDVRTSFLAKQGKVSGEQNAES